MRLHQMPAELPKEFRLPTVGGGLVNPEVNLDRTSELLLEQEVEHFLNVNARLSETGHVSENLQSAFHN